VILLSSTSTFRRCAGGWSPFCDFCRFRCVTRRLLMYKLQFFAFILIRVHRTDGYLLQHTETSFTFCRAMLCMVSVRVCVCLSRSWILLKRIFFSPSVATPFWFLHIERRGNIPTGTLPPKRGVKCRWSRQKSRFWANIWLHCVLWTVPVANAIHLAATDHDEFINAGKRPSLLMLGNNDEVYENKPQRYAEDNVTQW